jgi:hypothetical protein
VQAKVEFLSLQSVEVSLWKCMLVLELKELEAYSIKLSKLLHQLFLLMKLMQLVKKELLDLEEEVMIKEIIH